MIYVKDRASIPAVRPYGRNGHAYKETPITEVPTCAATELRGAILLHEEMMNQSRFQKHVSAHGGMYKTVLHETRECKTHATAVSAPFRHLSPLFPTNLEHCSQSSGFSPWPWIGAGKSRMPLLLLINFFPLHLSATAHRQEYFPIYIWKHVASFPKKPRVILLQICPVISI